MFRRRADDAPTDRVEPVEQPKDQAPVTKGRPTPTRREAEQARKQRLSGSADPKQQRRIERQRDVQARASLRDGGPVRGFCRDYVDSRFRASQLLLPSYAIIFISFFSKSAAAAVIVTGVFGVVVIAVAIETLLLFRGLGRGLRERFPNESHRGARFYSFTRSIWPRRFRNPKPRVKHGDAF